MPDNLTPEQRRRSMSNVKNKDTDIEVLVRSALHRRGLRFRKNVRNLPGSPDIVFPRLRIAVFIDGDFWHGFDFHSWSPSLSPFWRKKIAINIARDESINERLTQAGWCVLRIWQHDVQKNFDTTLSTLIAAVAERASPP